MEIEAKADSSALELEAKSENKELNGRVAITVLIVSVFLALSHLKDDNLVREMAFVKSDSVDVWNQYQAEKIKLHLDENQAHALSVLPAADSAASVAEKARLEKQVAKYTAEAAQLSDKARDEDKDYKKLEFRHDQYDVEDGVLSITLALTAVAALTEISWLLVTGWVFGAFGIVMGLAAMLGLGLHPEFLVNLLG
jgi:hypothetical protein